MTTTSSPSSRLADPWEMALIHRILLRGLSEARDLVAATPPGDRRRSTQVAEHVTFMLDGLHHHHTTEDEWLWPALHERARPAGSMVTRMEEQHAAVAGAVGAVRALVEPWAGRPDAEGSQDLARALDSVITTLSEHLADEERDVVPLIALHITQQEWDDMGKRAFDKFKPSERFTAMGQMIEVATPTEAGRMQAGLPWPIRVMWKLVFRRRYETYVRSLRG